MAFGRLESWHGCGALLGLVLLAGGCNQADAERLARIGQKLTARAESLTADQAGGFHKGWQTVCNSWQETTLAGRVAARLRWDKKLADAQVQASAAGTVVELKGIVRDADQRQRAVELAETTTGVEKVTDSLEVAAP
ncbi:MAG TPA: BON domain-containing protein [Gemmataceae bacterium]|nr:BON domain-containing protein [Gemmataceae bacterium]